MSHHTGASGYLAVRLEREKQVLQCTAQGDWLVKEEGQFGGKGWITGSIYEACLRGRGRGGDSKAPTDKACGILQREVYEQNQHTNRQFRDEYTLYTRYSQCHHSHPAGFFFVRHSTDSGGQSGTKTDKKCTYTKYILL